MPEPSDPLKLGPMMSGVLLRSIGRIRPNAGVYQALRLLSRQPGADEVGEVLVAGLGEGLEIRDALQLIQR